LNTLAWDKNTKKRKTPLFCNRKRGRNPVDDKEVVREKYGVGYSCQDKDSLATFRRVGSKRTFFG